jgi:hypothetical protein
MAAKKKAPAKDTRDISGRQLVKTDMNRGEWSDAKKLVEEIAPPEAQTKSYSGFVDNRVGHFMNALSGSTRLPGESYAGQGFYHENRQEVVDTLEAHPSNLTLRNALGAAGALSTRNTPEREKATTKELIKGHSQGVVSMTEGLDEATRHYDKDAKAVLQGRRAAFQIPTELLGKDMEFKDVPGEVVAAVSSPYARERGSQDHVTGVDLTEMGRTGMHGNRARAQDMLRTGAETDPHGNPKHSGYVDSHDLATPESKGEFNLRAMHLGKVARGEVAGGQGMFDFYGLRDSNEDILSNEAPTAEDSWMKSASYHNPEGSFKAAGETSLGKKTLTKNGVKRPTIGGGNTQFTAAGIEHAVHHQATVDASKQIQSDLDVDFTVPSIMVQEGVWADARRSSGDDPAFNASVREQVAQKKYDALSAPEQNASLVSRDRGTKTTKINSQQFGLFD